jgi:hypothetical protein
MSMLLLLSFLACASPQEPKSMPTTQNAAPVAAKSFVALAPAELEAAMKALLRAQDEEELVSPPIAGAVGPLADCGVGTIFRAPGQRLGLLLACGGETFRSEPVESWMPEEVIETFLMDVDGDGRAELVVVASYVSGMGPDGLEPFQANSVLAFDGKSFKHLEGVEGRVRALVKPEEVRAALSKR